MILVTVLPLSYPSDDEELFLAVLDTTALMRVKCLVGLYNNPTRRPRKLRT